MDTSSRKVALNNMLFILFFITFFNSIDCYYVHPQFSSLTTKNWTTCDEFLVNSTFVSDTILNIPWKEYFYWNWETQEPSIVTFKIASYTLIKRFESLLDLILEKKTSAELYIDVYGDIGGLLLSLNKTGLYRFIPSSDKPKIVKREFIMAMKQVGKSLVIMSCGTRFGVAYAPVYDFPSNNKMAHEEVSKVKFRSNYGRSIYDPTSRVDTTQPTTADDDPYDPLTLD